QTDIVCLRERDLLKRFATEVSRYQAQGESREYAFILSYQLAEDLARAFTDRVMFQAFLEAETAMPAGSLKNVLGLLRCMYAVINLEEDASFLRYGYLSPDNAIIVRKEVMILCSELRPHALAIVSSFGIPDAMLSPIAFDWVEANSWSSLQHWQHAIMAFH
ncbi:putative acyl-coenzyme A oxidase, partial [Tasmannia lanceolata]|uniref:putative acyl-coenzyme A oxidase n=1 Tax=Tasmannia lanceolata TaxID=3420 RepID=UPI0040642331